MSGPSFRPIFMICRTAAFVLARLGRFLRSGQHAYRSNHRETPGESVAAIVVTLFNDQTPPADVEMLYIKETVFGMRDGAPLMDCSHPCITALAAAFTGACNCV